MEKKYVVPDRMLEAVERAVEIGPFSVRPVVEAVLKYQAEHPPVPSDEQAGKMMRDYVVNPQYHSTTAFGAVEWMRIAYLAPEPEIPREVEGLFAGRPTIDKKTHDRSVVEAYELGLRAGRQG